MSQAENLLNSLTEEQGTSSALPINDILLIDAEGRITNVPNTEIILGVETDQDVERKYFKCPRIVGDNIDLTTLQLRINFQNANGDKDKYIVDDVTIDGDYINFTWLLSAKVLASKGTVVFAIQAVSVEDDGTVKNRWNTTLASSNVLETLIVDDLYDYEEEEARDVLTQLLQILEEYTPIETDSKYFDIDYDGIISLKPEYRGNATETYVTKYPFSKSDNGVDKEGSKISELPERIVIPQNVNGEQVTGFQKGMFCHNHRIKEVVLPSNVKSINNGMFREAIHLKKVENTEQIESIGSGAFSWTRVEEVRFPNLKTLGSNSFLNASCLRLIDIGNITSIGASTFQYCENLSEVLGGNSVTTINRVAFMGTRRLKNLPFLANVTSIGDLAFFSSRCDFEGAYSTMVANGCTFGTNATYKQFNDTDYWSSTTFTPCKNSLKSLFHQRDPRWANKNIANYVDENGQPCTYGSNGCAFVTLAEIYSAFENVHFDSPEEFVQILNNKGLLQYDYRYRTQWCQIANGLGYQTELISPMTKEGLQKVYDALAQGALIYKSTMSGTNVDGGHATLAYGINTDGEMLISETSMRCDEIGIYENHKNAWHIYKHGSTECTAVIVKKQG